MFVSVWVSSLRKMTNEKGKKTKRLNAKLQVGEVFPLERLAILDGSEVRLRKGEGLLHLHLARYTGCPVCNFHFKQFAEGYGQVKSKGIKSVFVLHSSKEDILEHQLTMSWTTSLNFISDEKKEIYGAVGLEPLSLWETIKSIPALIKAIRQVGYNKKYQKNREPQYQRPADILIDLKNGKIVDFKIASSQGDRWDFQQVIIKAGLVVSDAE